MGFYKDIGIYLLKFLGVFCLLYYGSLFVQGANIPGGLVSAPWLYKYFYYQDVLRQFLLHSSKWILELFGYHPAIESLGRMRLEQFRVRMHDACLGIGVMSFWVAYIVAGTGRWLHKIKWVALGLVAICLINIMRICLIVLAGHHQWINVFTFDHHMLFNIVAYILIFSLIWVHGKSGKKALAANVEKKDANPKKSSVQ